MLREAHSAVSHHVQSKAAVQTSLYGELRIVCGVGNAQTLLRRVQGGVAVSAPVPGLRVTNSSVLYN